MDKFSNQFSRNQLMNGFKEVVLDAEALLAATADTADESMSEIRAKTEQSLNIAKNKMADLHAFTLSKAKAATKATDGYVHEHPWRSIGLAASVGVIIGLLIDRR